MKMENGISTKNRTEKKNAENEEDPSTAAGRNQFSWLTERPKLLRFPLPLV